MGKVRQEINLRDPNHLTSDVRSFPQEEATLRDDCQRGYRGTALKVFRYTGHISDGNLGSGYLVLAVYP
jgi:hypothetical protein